jgi:hypothetical protein
MSRGDAEKDLAGILEVVDRYSGKESTKNGAVARSILQEEIGRFGKEHLPLYELDENTRDRLLAHGRQDVAYALCNTISLLKEVAVLKNRVNLLGGMSIVLLVGVGLKLWM